MASNLDSEHDAIRENISSDEVMNGKKEPVNGASTGKNDLFSDYLIKKFLVNHHTLKGAATSLSPLTLHNFSVLC